MRRMIAVPRRGREDGDRPCQRRRDRIGDLSVLTQHATNGLLMRTRAVAKKQRPPSTHRLEQAIGPADEGRCDLTTIFIKRREHLATPGIDPGRYPPCLWASPWQALRNVRQRIEA